MKSALHCPGSGFGWAFDEDFLARLKPEEKLLLCWATGTDGLTPEEESEALGRWGKRPDHPIGHVPYGKNLVEWPRAWAYIDQCKATGVKVDLESFLRAEGATGPI